MDPPTVKMITRCIGLYFLGLGFVLSSISVNQLRNTKSYNLLVNCASIAIAFACVLMPFITSSYIVNLDDYVAGRAMMIDLGIYNIAAILVCEALHVRGRAVIGELKWFRKSILTMRTLNVCFGIASLCCYGYAVGTNITTRDILGSTYYTYWIKLLETIQLSIGFMFYSFIDYRTLARIGNAKTANVRKQATKRSMMFIAFSMFFRVSLVCFKILSITGNYFPIDYYIYHLEIAFTLFQMRGTESVIFAITRCNEIHVAEEDSKGGSASGKPTKIIGTAMVRMV